MSEESAFTKTNIPHGAQAVWRGDELLAIQMPTSLLYDDVLSMMETSHEAVYALVNGEATVERDVIVDGERCDLRVSWGDDDYLCLNR